MSALFQNLDPLPHSAPIFSPSLLTSGDSNEYSKFCADQRTHSSYAFRGVQLGPSPRDPSPPPCPHPSETAAPIPGSTTFPLLPLSTSSPPPHPLRPIATRPPWAYGPPIGRMGSRPLRLTCSCLFASSPSRDQGEGGGLGGVSYLRTQLGTSPQYFWSPVAGSLLHTFPNYTSRNTTGCRHRPSVTTVKTDVRQKYRIFFFPGRIQTEHHCPSRGPSPVLSRWIFFNSQPLSVVSPDASLPPEVGLQRPDFLRPRHANLAPPNIGPARQTPGYLTCLRGPNMRI